MQNRIERATIALTPHSLRNQPLLHLSAVYFLPLSLFIAARILNYNQDTKDLEFLRMLNTDLHNAESHVCLRRMRRSSAGRVKNSAKRPTVTSRFPLCPRSRLFKTVSK